MIVVGDVHGKVNEFWQLLYGEKEEIIQLGDFGFKKQHDWLIENMPDVRVVFGNHDYYPYKYMNHSIGDFLFKDGVLMIRGAYSIDKQYRLEGIDWFRDEELTYSEFDSLIKYVESIADNVKLVITHECPQTIFEMIHPHYADDKSITRQGLESVSQIKNLNPDLWLFGHHHKSLKFNVNGIQYQCLNELETIKV